MRDPSGVRRIIQKRSREALGRRPTLPNYRHTRTCSPAVRSPQSTTHPALCPPSWPHTSYASGPPPTPHPHAISHLHVAAFSWRHVPHDLAHKHESKQSILFLITGKPGHGHGGSHGGGHSHSVRDKVAGPAATILQGIILLSCLYFTILICYRKPQAFWDWKVALCSFPVLVLNVFTAPDLISPMVFSLSIEDFRNVKVHV